MSFDGLSDEEIVDHVLEYFEEDGRVQSEFIKVESFDGKLFLSGRVPTDEQLQIVEDIMNDVLEVEHYENNIWVDDSLAFDGSEDEPREEDSDSQETGESHEEEGFEPEEDEES